MESFNQDLAESGELVDTRGLTASGAHPADLPAGRRPGGDRRAYAEAEEVPADAVRRCTKPGNARGWARWRPAAMVVPATRRSAASGSTMLAERWKPRSAPLRREFPLSGPGEGSLIMAVRAVLIDIGGVLAITPDLGVVPQGEGRLGLAAGTLEAFPAWYQELNDLHLRGYRGA